MIGYIQQVRATWISRQAACFRGTFGGWRAESETPGQQDWTACPKKQVACRL